MSERIVIGWYPSTGEGVTIKRVVRTRPLLIIDDEGPPADLEAMRRWLDAQPWVAEATEQRRRFEERHPVRPGSILDALRGEG